MASTTLIKCIQNDNNIRLTFYIDKDMRVESILGAIVEIQFINKTTGYVMTRNATITDAQAGECLLVLTSADTNLVGNYMVEITTTYSNGTKLTVQNPFMLSVTPQLAY